MKIRTHIIILSLLVIGALTIPALSIPTMPFARTDTKAAAYHGNVQSHIFHQANCRYYSCKACTAQFNTREKAIKAGYRPCKICKP
jgi:hypothetical protein